MAIDKHEQIRQRAHEIWEEEGRPEGSSLRHWLQAADELEEDTEHETLQDLIDNDDSDDRSLRQILGGSGKPNSPKSSKSQTRSSGIEKSKEALPLKISKMEGP